MSIGFYYYKTLCIEIDGILVDANENPHPMAETVLSKLLSNDYTVILWSNKGMDYCKRLFKTTSENIVFREKSNESTKRKIFFCLDTDPDFCKKFKCWSVLDPFDMLVFGSLDSDILVKTIDEYMKYVNNIERQYHKNGF